MGYERRETACGGKAAETREGRRGQHMECCLDDRPFQLRFIGIRLFGFALCLRGRYERSVVQPHAALLPGCFRQLPFLPTVFSHSHVSGCHGCPERAWPQAPPPLRRQTAATPSHPSLMIVDTGCVFALCCAALPPQLSLVPLFPGLEMARC